MGALSFLLWKKAKNRLFKGSILMALLALGGYLLLFYWLNTSLKDLTAISVPTLETIYFYVVLLYSLFFQLSCCLTGVVSYDESDQSYLFTAPIPNRALLLYGLYKKLLPAIGITFVLFLALAITLVDVFGFNAWQIIGLFTGALFSVSLGFFSMLPFNAALLQNRRRKFITVSSLIGAILLGATAAVLSFFGLLPSQLTSFFPVHGWIKALVFDFGFYQKGQWPLFAVLLSLFIAGTILLNRRYFSFNPYAALRTSRKPRPKTRRQPGELKGWGLTALFFKQARQSSRRLPLKFISYLELFMLCFIVILVIGLTQTTTENGEPLPPLYILLAVLFLLALFSAQSQDSFLDELGYPYLRLLPFKPTHKLLWLSLFPLLRASVQGGIALILTGIFVGAPFTFALSSIPVLISFVWLTVTAELIFKRLGLQADRDLIWSYLKVLVNLFLFLPAISLIIMGLIESVNLGLSLSLFLAIVVNTTIGSTIIYLFSGVIS